MNTTTIGRQARPDVAADASGGFVVVWESARGSFGRPLDVRGRRFDALGSPLGGEFVANTTDLGGEIFSGMIAASVDADASGEFVVAWESYYYSYDYYGVIIRDVLLRRYDDAGLPLGGDFSVSSFSYPDLPYRQTPSIGLGPSGGFLVVWNDSSFVLASEFDSNAQPETGILGPLNSGYNASGGFPAVTASGSDFLVVWGGYGDGSNRGVFVRRIDDSGQITDPIFQVNTFTTGLQVVPSVAADDEGFIVTWQSQGQDGDQDGIFGQIYDANGQTRGGEFAVNTHTLGSQASADVALDPDGDFLVVWRGQDQGGSGNDIFGQFYDRSGLRLGDEFQINTSTIVQQSSPAVTALGTGQFVVVWQSTDGGGTFGILGRRLAFCPPASPGPVADLEVDLDEAGANLVFNWTDTPEAEIFALFSDDQPDGSFDALEGSAFTGGEGGCGNDLCEPFAGEDCLSCPDDCNGQDTGPPGDRFCCGDGISGTTNPVTCEDERCTDDRVDCQPSLLTMPVPPGDKFFLVAAANNCDLGPKK